MAKLIFNEALTRINTINRTEIYTPDLQTFITRKALRV